MKSFYRTTTVQRQRIRLGLAAIGLFVFGIVMGSMTSSGTVDSSMARLRHHHSQKIAKDLASPLEDLQQANNGGGGHGNVNAQRRVVHGPEDLMDTDKMKHARGESLREIIAANKPHDAAISIGDDRGDAASRDLGKNNADEQRMGGNEEVALKDQPGRGLQCPPEDAAGFSDLQIPLKHLPRGKKTSVAEKYNRRAHNCISNGIWNRVTISDHHKILHDIVRIGRIQKNSFVLDWGSGCGHSLQFLYDEYDVTGVGIDVSNMTIAYARSNTTKADLHCVADGTKLNWIPSNFFDHAFSFGSIYHVYNRTMFCHVLRQLVRVVKPGGTVYNGWTENAEYKRVHVGMCLEDLDVTFEVKEEKKEFSDVSIFPLKAQQDSPNTYSLVITKGRATTEDESQFLLENIPITCGVHKCEKKSGGGDVAAGENEQKNKRALAEKSGEANGDGENAAAKSIQEQQAQNSGGEEEGDKEGWPTCPPYDAGIEALQIPLEHLPRKRKTSVAQKYDRRAHNCATHGIWHKVTIADHEAILKRIGELLEVKKDEALFDWGSGCGHQLDFMTRMFKARGLGIDVSNLTIAFARANTTKVNRHCVADGTRLGWIPSDLFDHAYSFGSIYHVYNKSKFCHVLQEMVRMVKPGGKIYNGWTENKEFHRNDVVKCINTDTNGNHKISILEEADLFHHVINFPLKQYRQTPNTYSLLIVKSG